MMVIPVINEKNFAEIVKKIDLIEPYSDWVQIDIADGVFTPNLTWNNPDDLLKLKSNISIEMHLMIRNPEDAIENWLKIPQIKRAVIHLEGITDLNKIMESGKKYQKEIGLAINPETPWEILKPYLEKINFVQILAVKPGLAGQKFNPEIIDKIKSLREFKKDVIIEVDGGVSLENARLLKAVGADILNSATYIFESPNIKEAINALENI